MGEPEIQETANRKNHVDESANPGEDTKKVDKSPVNHVWLPLGYHKDLVKLYRGAIKDINNNPMLEMLWSQAKPGKPNPLSVPKLKTAFSNNMPNQGAKFRNMYKPKKPYGLKAEERKEKQHQIRWT